MLRYGMYQIARGKRYQGIPEMWLGGIRDGNARMRFLPKAGPLLSWRPMHSHEVFKQLLKRVSAKQIAGDLGLSLSLVYKWAEPPSEGSGATNPLDRIDSIIKLTGDGTLAQWVCERSGGFFIRNPEPKSHPYELIPATNNIVQEFADLLGVISTSVADAKITPEEAERLSLIHI